VNTCSVDHSLGYRKLVHFLLQMLSRSRRILSMTRLQTQKNSGTRNVYQHLGSIS